MAHEPNRPIPAINHVLQRAPIREAYAREGPSALRLLGRQERLVALEEQEARLVPRGAGDVVLCLYECVKCIRVCKMNT